MAIMDNIIEIVVIILGVINLYLCNISPNLILKIIKILSIGFSNSDIIFLPSILNYIRFKK